MEFVKRTMSTNKIFTASFSDANYKLVCPLHPVVFYCECSPSSLPSSSSTISSFFSSYITLLLLLLSCFIDGSPPGSPIPGILQARTLEWVAISSSNA